MKKMLTLILTLMLLLTTLPTLANAPDTSPFIIDISAMSAEAQKAWNSFFEMTGKVPYSGDANYNMNRLPENKGKIIYNYTKGTMLRIYGDEPVELLIEEEVIFSSHQQRHPKHDTVYYLIIPQTSDYLIVNSKQAYETGNYSLIGEYPEMRYYYDEYRLWIASLLAPVKENNEQPYEAIDVYFQSEDRILHHGLITVEFSDTGYKLVMKPVE